MKGIKKQKLHEAYDAKKQKKVKKFREKVPLFFKENIEKNF